MAASMMLGKLSCPASAVPPTGHGEAATVIIPPPAPESAAPTAAVTATPPESAALPGLRRDAVLSSAPARGTLFTWTTRDQIEELIRNRVLLTRTESPVHGPAFYDQVLAARAAAGDALATKLRTPGFARSRFAWASPWPTLLGWPGETYGEELVAVRLKPDRVDGHAHHRRARVGGVRRRQPPCRSRRGGPPPGAHRRRLLRAGHTGDRLRPHQRRAAGAGRLPRARALQRVDDRELVHRRRPREDDPRGERRPHRAARPRSAPGENVATPLDTWNAGVAHTVWPGPALQAPRERVYEAALTFPNPSYVLTPERMTRLAKRLRAVSVHGPSLTHTPTAAPPAVSASVKPLPPPVPRKGPARQGTWARRGTH